MKTIDFLVEELPKRGGWPDGAIGAGFLSGEGTLYFWDKNNDCPPKWTIDTDIEVEDGDEEVTREQYEAALSAKSDGWIEWGGGDCPLDHGLIIDAKDRDGYIHYGEVVGKSLYIDDIFWNRGVCALEDNEIIAYRLHKPQEVEQEEADDEADLNECIGQGVSPVWNGEGLPPVGCECEFMKHTLDAIPNYRRGIIKYVSEYTVVIVEALSHGEFVAHPRTCDFRPIRPEADRKRDIAVGKIFDVICKSLTDESESTSFAIYDAIAAGKIPGVKLDD